MFLLSVALIGFAVMSRFAVDRFSRWIILAGVLFNVFTVSVAASSEYQQALYGEWGTETQCSRELITPKGTRRAAPFDIQRDWLEQGDVWCQLIWRKVSATDDGLFGLVSALCGEDTGRSYDLRFRLSGDQLTLVWGLWHKNGPLQRCEG